MNISEWKWCGGACQIRYQMFPSFICCGYRDVICNNEMSHREKRLCGFTHSTYAYLCWVASSQHCYHCNATNDACWGPFCKNQSILGSSLKIHKIKCTCLHLYVWIYTENTIISLLDPNSGSWNHITILHSVCYNSYNRLTTQNTGNSQFTRAHSKLFCKVPMYKPTK